MPKAAIWVHGNAAVPECPEDLFQAASYGSSFRQGWGTTFMLEQKVGYVQPIRTWFHFPMPTPVILDGVLLCLAKIFVFYETKYSKITDVHIYDGPQKVKEWGGLSFIGNHKFAVDASNSLLVNPPITIQFGLGVSVCVEFHTGAPNVGDSLILFTAAGADFEEL